MNRILWALIVSASLTAISCATRGRHVDFERANRVEVGMTEAQVLELMGKPTDVHKDGAGEMWMWIYVQVGPGQSRSESFAVRFTGHLVSWTQAKPPS